MLRDARMSAIGFGLFLLLASGCQRWQVERQTLVGQVEDLKVEAERNSREHMQTLAVLTDLIQSLTWGSVVCSVHARPE